MLFKVLFFHLTFLIYFIIQPVINKKINATKYYTYIVLQTERMLLNWATMMSRDASLSAGCTPCLFSIRGTEMFLVIAVDLLVFHVYLYFI